MKYEKILDQGPSTLKEQLEKICNTYRENSEPSDYRFINKKVHQEAD